MILPEDVTQARTLVDTDVFSYILKRETRADFFKPYLLHRTAAISFMSVAELYYGAYKDEWRDPRITGLENSLKNYVVLPYDYEVARLWGVVRVEHQKRGHDIGQGDCWIAATALRHDCALLTNNGKDFVGTSGLTVTSPAFA